jgi:chromosome segregation protein
VFLKSLTLRGFKSFADPTTLELEPGVTVVVGPNGSGKSNVVDAVAWVLGAQGPRTVRSTKMDDVIFAGTARRPALGRAEVSLTIDNSARRLPIDFTEVTVTRTLFRTGDSEYALNGTPCRLLDIQELFSDTGVGRQQHVIIGQGQLDTILSARPEDRRAVIEEAAGVLKYRRRRERAERRLEATEGSLIRLQDLLREVRRQLKPLERQAEASRRHGALAAELRALRMHLAGRELAELERREQAAVAASGRLEAEEAAGRARLAALDEVLVAGEALADSARTSDVSELLARLEAVRERARGMAGLCAERRRSVLASLEAGVDGGVVAAREGEAEATEAELEDAERRAGDLSPEWDDVGEQEARLAEAVKQLEERYAERETRAPEGGAAAAVRAEIASRRERVAGLREELARVEERISTLERRGVELGAAAEQALAAKVTAAEATEELAGVLAVAEVERLSAAGAAAGAAEELRACEHALHAAVARSEALSLALDEARARAGVEQLSEVAGVLGTLLDAVEIEPGYELAFEAAAAGALEAVVVLDVTAGRSSLAALRSARGGGAVMVAGLPAGAPATAPPGVDLLSGHVRVTLPAAAPAVERLIAGAVCCSDGFERACDMASSMPGVTVVTPEGDRFAADGWRVGAGRAGVTRSALEDTLATLAASRSAVEAAADVAAAAKALADAADQAFVGARRRAEQLEADLRRHSRSCDELAADAAVVQADLLAAQARRRELAERVGAGEAGVVELGGQLQQLELAEAEASALLAEERAERAAVEDRARALAALRSDLEIRAAGLEERRRLLGSRLAEVRRWLEEHEEGRQAAAVRRDGLIVSRRAIGRLAGSVAASQSRLEEMSGRLRAERDRHVADTRDLAARLARARRDRTATEQELAGLRERIQRIEIELTEIRMRHQAAAESVRDDLEAEPEEVLGFPSPELPDGVTAAQRAREVDHELRALGPVNALAEDELRALEERHSFLAHQLDDVRSARRELGGVVRAVDAEIEALFDAAYLDVGRHFEDLFGRLFPGGSGRLVRTEGESPLDGGIEIEARPAGRNVRRLSLLSGGERSLVALAFLFAVFRSRPSPFYLMDEVEAALDDVNLHRFLDLVDEFRAEAQLIIVSHQKRTMEAADVLYGVTMQAGGASKVVSERVVGRLRAP